MIYKAKWILRVDKPPIENGSIEIQNGKIVKIGKKITGKTVDLGSGVMLPALINSHTHLEMPKIDTVSHKGFIRWLRSFIKEIKVMDRQFFQENLQKNETVSKSDGTSFVCDITNHANLTYKTKGVSFAEQIGWDDKPIVKLEKTGNSIVHSYAAHAIYSTSPEKIKASYFYCKANNLPWSIHLAESAEEIAFCSGKGEFIDFLNGFADINYIKIPHLKPAVYLDSLGVLRRNSILVHSVHLSDEEIELIAQKGCTICVCPRSNEYIGVGRADIEKFLEKGINVVAGTDSLLSNDDLSMIKEIEYIVDNFKIAPYIALKFATINAQKALGVTFGKLEEGYNAPLLFVQGNSSDPYEIIFDGKANIITD